MFGPQAASLLSHQWKHSLLHNHLTHHWLKRQLILDFSKSVTSPVERASISICLEQCSPALPAAKEPQLPRMLLEASCQWAQHAFELGGGKNCP